jgi:hypothetical protein
VLDLVGPVCMVLLRLSAIVGLAAVAPPARTKAAMSRLVWLVAALTLAPSPVAAMDNGLARTPPMGWS